MISVEMLTPARRPAFLASRNSLFTPVSTEYWNRAENPESPFRLRTCIGHDGSKVLAWGSFYLRQLDVGRTNVAPIRVGMACAIGTLPGYQRQGLGAKVWRAAEKQLAQEADGIMVYTGEGGSGYPFYRAMGYLPLSYPPSCQLTVARPMRAATSHVRTSLFPQSEVLGSRRNEVFHSCYRGYGGFMAGRPESLDQWARASFFYDPDAVGCTPRISWLEDTATGRWKAYALWAGPIDKVDWKKRVVEIWELACDESCDLESIRSVLQPACAAALKGSGKIDWWLIPGHPLTDRMLTLGFIENPRSLSVLGKVFDPARKLDEQLRARQCPGRVIRCASAVGGGVEVRLDECELTVEHDAAMRIVFGRSNASLEHRLGLLTVRPLHETQTALKVLDIALPIVPWCYFASEYI